MNEKGYIEAIKETKLVEAIEPGVVESTFPPSDCCFPMLMT